MLIRQPAPQNRLRNQPAILLVVAILGLSGCTTTPEPTEPEIQSNPDLDQAVIDLQQAEAQGALWVVRDPDFGNKLVSLQQILDRAASLHAADRQDAASEVARRVSRYARLGMIQAQAESNARPYYPQ